MTTDRTTSRSDEARLLRKLVDNVPALVAYWDQDRRNVVANDGYREWFGLSPEEIRGRHMREVLGEEVYAKNLPHIDAAYRGEGQHFDRTLVDPQGRVRHSQADYIPEVVEGEVVGVFVLVTDTTEKVETQRQLDDAQAIAHVGSWVYYPSTAELSWSQEMYRLIDADPDTDVPSTELWKSRVHPDDRERAAAVQGAASLAARSYEQHYRLLLPGGRVRFVASRGRPVEDTGGAMTRMVGTILDETDLRVVANELVRSNDQIAATNDLLSDTVAMLGHDVKQPIQAVSGFLEFTRDSWVKLSDEQRLDNVSRALQSSLRLRNLVDNILTLMNVESGTLKPRPAEVILADEIDEAIGHAVPGLEVSRDVDPELVARVDPFHLRQALVNLISNAAKYGAAPFEVTAHSDDGTVTIEVVDHGEGVPEEFVPHLFDRFTRAESGAAVSQSGSGFGLHLARSLVEANGGTLTYSPNLPSGSRFTVTLAPAVT